ncbi:MAG: hypothetical protein QF561_01275 [Phycisphaerales bacterium]|jgi:hypothetical protein|nr:hypothetical protein [Phycisphaerales bacterium]
MIRTMSIALAAASLTGCNLNYAIELQPDGERLLRRTRVDAEIEPAEIAALKDAYGQPASPSNDSHGKDTPPKRLVFHGIDSGSGWPDGFGGRGSWIRYDSPLGSADCFLECLGGDIPALSDILALQDGIDAVISLCRKHLREGMKNHRMLPRILRLIDDRVGPDVRDAAILGWALLFSYETLPDRDTTGDGPGAGRLADHLQTRIEEAAVAFLWQRGWITPAEAAALINHDADFSELTNRVITRALHVNMDRDGMHQMGLLEDDVSSCFPEDFDDDVNAAFASAVSGHPRLAVAWAATSSILTSRDVSVRLQATERPASTNGHWNDEHQYVEWTLDTAPLAVGLTAPPLCWSASWATPNETEQTRILGHVGLGGEALVSFCLAWNAASEEQRKSTLDIIDSFANARHGTDIKVESTDLLGECLRVLQSY